VLGGQVIKINPALITITEGLIAEKTSEELQHRVVEQVVRLLSQGVRTFHVDVNFEDYSGFSASRPDLNGSIFSPRFLHSLNTLVHASGAFLNLHLLTDFPSRHLAEYASVGAGAICFQLDAVPHDRELARLLALIQDLGACASPVIETVGSDNLKPPGMDAVLMLLEPFLSQIGMLTFQVAGTASRTHSPAGRLAKEQAISYIAPMREMFGGAIQLQGGITTQTIGDAVRLGAEFFVCGSEVFRNRRGRPPEKVIDDMLRRAAEVLCEDEGECG
jgi:pentose-5-phosphate-3-epimerase